MTDTAARELIEDYFRTVFERGNPKSFADDLIAALHAAGFEIKQTRKSAFDTLPDDYELG